MATTIPTTTASTRPSNPSTGDAYFETDTKKYIIYDGTDWRGWNNDGIAAAPLTNTYSVDLDGSDDYVDLGDLGTAGRSLGCLLHPDCTATSDQPVGVFLLKGPPVNE